MPIVIAVLFIAVLASVIVLGVVKHLRARPKIWVGGVGVTYKGAAVQPYEGLEEAVHVLRSTLAERYEKRVVSQTMDFWLEIYGPEDEMQNTASVRFDGDYNGLTGKERATPVSPKQTIVKVRQLRNSKDEIRPIGASAFFHEVVEHWLSECLGLGDNVHHTNTGLTALSKEMSRLWVIEFGRKP